MGGGPGDDVVVEEVVVTKEQASSMNVVPGRYMKITVADDGPGIPPEIVDNIFDPFFTTKGTEGTGLGMSQVYGFVQQSYGTINVFSKIGKGAHIEINFPRANETETSGSVEDDSLKIDSPLGHENILVVDDERALLGLMENILASKGYTVSCAESGDAALQILKEKPIDLMISDVIMPGMSGYELASNVSKLYPKIKIQIISGFADAANIDDEQETLHEDRLHKPVSPSVLLHQVRKILDGN